jgi:chemotaxis response regulator CheB
MGAGNATAPDPRPPIVGIGCSAGGLDALERFLTHMPPTAGAAVVIVQHLAPSHASALPELLQRFTGMLVVEAREGMPIRPDTIHIIPPNHDLAVLGNTLHLVTLGGGSGPHLSVDHFLRSLAQDRQQAAIGIVLSGMGSDGTLGLQAIKKHGGLTLVQDPASAQADGMPRSALHAGVADIVTLTEIPAPPFGEGPKAAHYLEMLRAHGLEDVELDGIGNAMGLRRGAGNGKLIVVAVMVKQAAVAIDAKRLMLSSRAVVADFFSQE